MLECDVSEIRHCEIVTERLENANQKVMGEDTSLALLLSRLRKATTTEMHRKTPDLSLYAVHLSSSVEMQDDYLWMNLYKAGWIFAIGQHNSFLHTYHPFKIDRNIINTVKFRL